CLPPNIHISSGYYELYCLPPNIIFLQFQVFAAKHLLSYIYMFAAKHPYFFRLLRIILFAAKHPFIFFLNILFAAKHRP
ncbi:MAG: hypothetical protein KGJ13_00005, partial [Patescibacteria group bacterium]|nr:hypothetical protein [Patescibacteria group bacterium]